MQFRTITLERNSVYVDAFPNKCGLCGKNVDPVYIGGAFHNGGREKAKKMELSFQCPNNKCNSLIIGYYERTSENPQFALESHAPIRPVDRKFNEEILEVSQNFTEIYNQSYFAEQNDLTQISGIGYRKALEFLIKDYLIYIEADDTDKILKEPLGQCINKLDNLNIKEIAKRATWIGNDEAHYIRKWEDKDVNDLKKLIEVTVYFIAMDISSKKYLNEMS
ncbi:DUF4145 domain-containing protein [Salibacterium aidingense]|uniref:DUF4145 domain-containing protein n=1 Tax=Salibacterium aidingense TaxID=384933 RepID=UPI0004258F85|nr:DUF4145 domain-containing protein [Salibacterium aidingense]